MEYLRPISTFVNYNGYPNLSCPRSAITSSFVRLSARHSRLGRGACPMGVVVACRVAVLAPRAGSLRSGSCKPRDILDRCTMHYSTGTSAGLRPRRSPTSCAESCDACRRAADGTRVTRWRGHPDSRSASRSHARERRVARARPQAHWPQPRHACCASHSSVRPDGNAPGGLL